MVTVCTRSCHPHTLFKMVDSVLKKEGEVESGARIYIADNGSLKIGSLKSSFWKGIAARLFQAPPDLRTQYEQSHKAWDAFAQGVIELVGKKHFEAVCRRYDRIVALPSENVFFTAGHVRLFYTALSQLTMSWIEERGLKHPKSWAQWFCLWKKDPQIEVLDQLKRNQLTQVIHDFYNEITSSDLDETRLLNLPKKKLGILVGKKELALARDENRSLGSLVSDVQNKRGIAASKIENRGFWKSPLTTRFFAWLEAFCKKGVSQDWMKGQLIPVPGEDGREDWYEVYAKVAAGGLVAYALIPVATNSSLQPLLVFRPTQTELGSDGAVEALSNDVELHIGHSGWMASRSAFEELLEDPHFRPSGQKIVVAGHSLGGAQLQYFLYNFSEAVSQAFSFNAPAIDAHTADVFAENVNDNPGLQNSLSLYIIRSIKDRVTYFGDKHLGCGVRPGNGVTVELFDATFKDAEKMNAYQHHGEFICGHALKKIKRCVFGSELIDALDNSKRGPDVAWYRHLHYQWGWIIFSVTRLISFITRLLTWTFRLSSEKKGLLYQWN